MTRIALYNLFFLSLSFKAFSQQSERPPNVEVMRKGCFEENNAGVCLSLSKAVRAARDEPELQRTLMKLCELNDGASCMELGTSAEKAKAYADAGSWYRKACDMGYKQGVGCIAMAKLASGQHQKTNAKIWLKKACDHGDQDSCKLLK